MSAEKQLPQLPPLPALVEGHVCHARRGPVRHAFRHAAYQWLVDLDDLPRLPWYLRPFASFRAGDHLGEADASIKDNVRRFLGRNGIRLGDGCRIVMLANARVLGHVFDPLSVFWCLAADGELACVVAEVHNTYGQRHAYLLRPDERGVARTDKQLYVSPFHDVSGQYELRFTLDPARVATAVTLRRDGQVTFTARFGGRPTPATTSSLTRLLVRSPLMPQRVSLLIRAHGIWLWLRRLPIAARPRHHTQEGV